MHHNVLFTNVLKRIKMENNTKNTDLNPNDSNTLLQEVNLRVNDVYSFRYNAAEIKKRLESYHCFDGQLIAKKRNGKLILEDTYWAHGGNRTFTLAGALREGTLTFKCNLDDVEEIKKHELSYYADEDVFNLSHQHNCYSKYAKRKGAQRNKEKMLAVLTQQIVDEKSKIEHAQRSLVSLNEKLQKLESGDIQGVWL